MTYHDAVRAVAAITRHLRIPTPTHIITERPRERHVCSRGHRGFERDRDTSEDRDRVDVVAGLTGHAGRQQVIVGQDGELEVSEDRADHSQVDLQVDAGQEVGHMDVCNMETLLSSHAFSRRRHNVYASPRGSLCK